MIVACCSYGKSQKVLIIVHCLDDCRKEQQELCVLGRSLARREKILALIGGYGPVIVLARTVHSCKGLFVEETHKIVAESYLLHHFHSELIVVCSDIRCIVDRCKLVLCGSYLVVFSLCKDAKLPEFTVKVSHILGNSRLDGTEVVIVHFLSLRRHCAEESASRHNEILSLLPHITVHKEVFLLGTYGSLYALYACIAEELQYSERLFINCFH